MAATGVPAHTLDAAALLRSVRQELQSRIGTVATRIERKHRPEDLVLPRRTRDKIHELVAFARNRKRVLQDWRLSDKFVYGTSISALFSGPPGTGKTMVASVIAHALGLEIYRIDLSRVLSRWIGETEKNLATVFDEAERSQAILLFDEADSLFARRTQVQSVQDRYANIETNFLLQRIETYEGIAILTTNFERSIDEAFIRRIRFRIQFEMPSRRERRRIWASLVPASIPTSEMLDFDLLARNYKLSGGNIKNAVLRGCVAAAETGKTVSTQLLAACAEMELAESGRLVNERYRSALHVL
jgi:SpoVK/Ycf46/Vps4 family AAA+-type ATPase